MAAATVFAATFLLLALGRIGQRPVPRGVASLAGGGVTALVLGIVPSPATIDIDVLLLLAGLMALTGLCAATGLFYPVQVSLSRMRPMWALAAALATTGLSSAALLNDAAVVALLPILVPPLRAHGLPLVPSVVLLAVSANVGSLLTPFGNPQNAILARAGGLGVVDFLAVQAPVVLLGGLCMLAGCWWYARHVEPPAKGEPAPPSGTHAARIVAMGAIVGFLAAAALAPVLGASLGMLAAGTAILLLAALQAQPAMRQPSLGAVRESLDWNVLALFVGLYLLTAGLSTWFPPQWVPTHWLGDPARAAGVAIGLSNTIGNVPATLVLHNLVPAWTATHAAFLVTVTTVGGALLLTGSAASLIAADVARKHGVEVRFLPFLRHAAPWALPALLFGIWWAW